MFSITSVRGRPPGSRSLARAKNRSAAPPAERLFALAKPRDPGGRPLTDVIENIVVDRVGNYVAFPLRSIADTTPEWRSALIANVTQPARASQEFSVTLPVPGVWLRSELF